MAKTTDWRPGPTVCRCCLSEGCYKDISTEYFWMGKREVYQEMLSETFTLSIAYSQSNGPNSHSRLICEPCISRLRDASEFKRQVLECEKTFMSYLDPGSSVAETTDSEVPAEPMETEVKVERVKEEKPVSDDDFDDRGADFHEDQDDDDDDMDDQPLTRLASKVPKKESVDIMELLDTSKPGSKRKSSSKAKTAAVKKTKSKKEAKATCSKAPKPEKKKKGLKTVKCGKDGHSAKKRNAAIVLECSTVYPFRLKWSYIQCVYCHVMFEDPDDLRSHLDESHKDSDVSDAFSHLGNRRVYLNVDITDLKCKLCEEPCKDLKEVAEHIRNQHGRQDLNLEYEVGMQQHKLDKENWDCFHCNKRFPSVTTLCNHTLNHYKNLVCDYCNKRYRTKISLKLHIRHVHTNKLTCIKCRKDFPTLQAKREHTRTSEKCRPFGCVECGERFSGWEMKKKHLVNVHSHPERTHQCPDCSEVYLNSKKFYRHYKAYHTNEGFACTFCDLKFAFKGLLDEHIVAHTRVKRFKCPQCLKLFACNKSLQRHIRNFHELTIRFVCLICDEQFSRKDKFKKHTETKHPGVEIVI